MSIWGKATGAIRRWRARKTRVVVFFLELPDALPFPDGWICGFELDERLADLEGLEQHPSPNHPALPFQPGHSFVSLRFWQVSVAASRHEFGMSAVDEAIRRSMPPELHPDTSAAVELPATTRTVVEAVTPVDFRQAGDVISPAFDICLQKLNDLVAAYRIYSHHAVPLITRQRLPFSTLYATRSLYEPWEWVGMSMMLLHMNVPFMPDELSAEDIENVSNRMSLSLSGHPLMLSSGHAKEAQVAFERDGDYGEVLVQTQIAGEILLDGVLTLMLWEEGTSPEDGSRPSPDRKPYPFAGSNDVTTPLAMRAILPSGRPRGSRDPQHPERRLAEGQSPAPHGLSGPSPQARSMPSVTAPADDSPSTVTATTVTPPLSP